MVFCICCWLCKPSRLAVLCFGFGTAEWAALFLTAWLCQPEAEFDINCVVFVFFYCYYSSRMWLRYIVLVEKFQIVRRTGEMLPKFLRTGTPLGRDNLVVSHLVTRIHKL